VQIDLVTLLVDDQDVAIDFFVGVLGFELTTDEPATTNDGRPKRWVEVRPPGAATGLLLAVADGDEQVAAVGRHAGGRIGLFLRVDDFESARRRMEAAGVEFLGSPRTEPYGEVAVFVDVAGNKWDLLGPDPRAG
jgi:catechol 2,3-dioxygenase-like lactoylglutathione lyase family enzyme